MRRCPTCGSTWTKTDAFCPYDGHALESVEAPTVDEAAAIAPPDAWIGKLLDDRYLLEQKLGEGGMGLVYRAKHVALRTQVAVKILHDRDARNAEMVERLRREAESASRIGHPNIVKMLDFGRLPSGLHYLVMELLEGHDVASLLARDGAFAADHAVALLIEAASALEAAHRADVLHRDLKPENLFLARTSDGRERLVVVDFGLAKSSSGNQAKLTTPGTIFGSPKYMAPEQGMGRTLDARADVYALGCVAYEMLTGKAPFEGETPMGVLNQHFFDAPPAMASTGTHAPVPPAIEAVVLQAMAKDPAHRPSSMAALRDALAHAVGLPAGDPSERRDTSIRFSTTGGEPSGRITTERAGASGAPTGSTPAGTHPATPGVGQPRGTVPMWAAALVVVLAAAAAALAYALGG